MYVKMKYVLTCSKQLRRQKWWHCPWSKFLVVLHQMSPFSNPSQWSDPCKEQWRKFQVQQVLLTWLGQVGKWLLFHILGPYWCKSIGKMGTSVRWELPAMEQSYSICCRLKWRKRKTQIWGAPNTFKTMTKDWIWDNIPSYWSSLYIYQHVN